MKTANNIIILMILTFLFNGCNNYFHDLIPPDENRIVSFSVEGMTERARITDNTITAVVDSEVSLHTLIPAIRISPKATLLPLTLDYLSATFPNLDIVSEAAAVYGTDDVTSHVMDLIERTPGFNVPALDKPIDFTGPVNFLVVSGQGNIRQYTVYVVMDTDEPRLLGMAFSKHENPELIIDAYTMVNENAKTIQTAALYPMEMQISYALIPSFDILGDKLEVDGLEIRSGVDAIQFSPILGQQSKTVTVWRNELSVDYTLTVLFSEDIDSIRSIIDFRFNKAENTEIAATAVGTIVNNDNAGTISVQVFYSGARPSHLTARFISPGTVSVAGAPQSGGVSSQNFSQTLTYRVVSRNGLYARTYTVNVEFVDIANAAPRITSFMFSCGVNHVLLEDAQAQISESAGVIMLSARCGGYTAPESLIPQFSATGIVTVAGTVQTSGYSAQNFARQIMYTVTNPENPLLTRDYWVQVNLIRDTSSDAVITAFSLHPDENPGLSTILTGTITQDTITVYAPEGSRVNEKVMIPRFTAHGTVSVNGAVQSSGVSGLVFDAPIVYTVVSANGLNRRGYTVIVRELKPVIYVNKNATGSNDGLTWQDAFTDLRTACQAAAGMPADLVKEIWIAAGTYTPGPNTDYYFPVAPNTSYIGGFAGWENFKSQKNKAAYPVVISGDIPKGSMPSTNQNSRENSRRAAFYSLNITSGKVSFEDLEFRDFMQNELNRPGEAFYQFIYTPIFTGWVSGAANPLLEVKGCYFSDVNNYCIENYGLVILKDIRAYKIASLCAGYAFDYYITGDNLIDNVEVISQIELSGYSPPEEQVLRFSSRFTGAVTVSNVTLQDCIGGLSIRGGISGESQIMSVNIDNLKIKNRGNTDHLYGAIQIIEAVNVNVSNVDIDAARKDSSGTFLIACVKNNVNLENISIKNASYPNLPTSVNSRLGIIQFGWTAYPTSYSAHINNCYFEVTGTGSDRNYFIDNQYDTVNLTIQNTRFNFNGINPNLGAIRATAGFNLENVTFENSVSTPLLSITGTAPYRLKRSGSFFNGVPLTNDATFADFNARVEKTGGAVLVGE
jgi:hypothetical protein